jgi:hypothetical protein
MATKTAILNAADMTLVMVAENKEQIKACLGETPDAFVLVTNKTFVASEQYKTFKDMCTKPKTAEEIEQDRLDAEAAKAAGEDINNAGANKAKRASASDLKGDYHLTKDLPACAEDHPKFPIWAAIAGNKTVETAKAACPATNPARKTSGTYSFASEFRYFLKTGYVKMGLEEAKVDGETNAEPEQAAA